MTSFVFARVLALGLVISVTALTAASVGQDAAAAAAPAVRERSIEFGPGDFRFSIPEAWEAQKPRSSMIQHEFSVKSEDASAADGRITMMSAGGSVQANLDRWVAQFEKAQSTQDILDLAETRVHFISIQGIYHDRPQGPRGPSIAREDYRMLGAIVETGPNSSFFVKFYGPSPVIAESEGTFKELLNSLQRGN